MNIQGASASFTTGEALEIASLKMAKNQQEQDGQASLKLLESAAVTAAPVSANPSLGATINTYA